MKHRAHLLLTLLFFAAFCLPSNAQTEAMTPEPQPAQCNREVALSLVETQVDDGKTVVETDKRIKILLRGADFLWSFDESVARKYFQEAFDLARERYNEKGVEEKKTENNSGRIIFGRKDFRFEVLTVVARRDAKWAEKLTDAVLQDMQAQREKNQNADSSGLDNETDWLLDVASNLLETNNKPAAFQYARRAARLANAQSTSRWHSFLYRLAQFDQREADAIYAELLQTRSTTAKINDLFFLSGYPFGNERTYGVSNSSVATMVPKNFAPNANLQRQFLNVLIGATMALQPNADAAARQKWHSPDALVAFSMWQDLEPIVVERFSDLLPRVTTAKARANSLMTAENNSTLEEKRRSRDRWQASFEKKLEALEKNENEKTRDFLIVDLVFAAKTDAELEKASDWVGKMGEAEARGGAANYLNFKRAELAVTENRLADAERFAEKVSELEHRAVIAFRIAEAKLKQENDRLRAAEVLETTVKAALKAPNGVERAQVLLGTAFWFEKYNQYRAAETLAEAVRTINRVENPDLSASYIYRVIKGKDFMSATSINTPGYNFEKSFAQVAKKDFQGALSQARNLDDKSLRTLAVIAVVADCGGEQKREPSQKSAPRAKSSNTKTKSN